MSRLLGLLAAFALLAATFPAVADAAPGRASSSRTLMYCELPSDAGPVTLSAEINDTETSVSVLVWAPDESPLAISMPAEAAFDGTNLTARFEMVDFNSGVPVGSADLVAVLHPDGPLQHDPGRDTRDGNRWLRLDESVQFLDVAGSLELNLGDGSRTIDLGPCDASTMEQSIFASNPNAWLSGIAQVSITCEWVTERGAISLSAAATEGRESTTQVVVVTGERAFVGISAPTLSAAGFDATYEVSDASTGEPAGTVTASAVLAGSGERITENQLDGRYRLRTTGERLSVDGTLTADVLGATYRLRMDDSVCAADDVRVQFMEKDAQF